MKTNEESLKYMHMRLKVTKEPPGEAETVFPTPIQMLLVHDLSVRGERGLNLALLAWINLLWTWNRSGLQTLTTRWS